LRFRELFPAHYSRYQEDLEQSWGEAHFAFDASILLHLFRCPINQRQHLIEVFRKLENRLWLRFHGALEYHRNQKSVAEEQRTSIDRVRQTLEKALRDFRNAVGPQTQRHALLETGPFVREVEESVERFRDQLDEVERAHVERYEEVPLLRELEAIFAERVGPPPATQAQLDKWVSEAKTRIANSIPPGYLDARKSRADGSAEFSYGGLRYSAEAGDYLVWNQTLEFAKERSIKKLVFVTNDRKSDWWWEESGKRLGPRPELVEEARRIASIEFLGLVSIERFLERQLPEDAIAAQSPTLVPIAGAEMGTPSIVQSSPGPLDALASVEELIPKMTQLMGEFVLDMKEMTAAMNLAAKRLQQAQSARDKRAVVNDLASELDFISPRLEERVNSYEAILSEFVPAFRVLFSTARSEGTEVDGLDAIRSKLAELQAAVRASTENSKGLVESLRQGGVATSSLRLSTGRIASILERYCASSESFAEELGALYR